MIRKHKSSVTCNIIHADSTTTRVSGCYSTLKLAVTTVTNRRKPAFLRSNVTAGIALVGDVLGWGSVTKEKNYVLQF